MAPGICCWAGTRPDPSPDHAVRVKTQTGTSRVSTDYTAAITGLVLLIAVLTAMVVYLLTRPSDLPRKP
jgi:hypothetical protein